jgi:hypothetical protein
MSARSVVPSASTTPVTRSAASIDVTSVPVRISTPASTATRSNAARSASSPPIGYQQPYRASMCGMQASVAGAPNGEEPE